MSDYNKLSNLIDQEITINSVGASTFKMWDAENKKMLTSETWQNGFRKVYQVDTNQGLLDISAHQIGQMLESVSVNGSSDIRGAIFKVKSNGKTGLEIRYYINPVNPDTVKVEHTHTVQSQPNKEETREQPTDDLPFIINILLCAAVIML